MITELRLLVVDKPVVWLSGELTPQDFALVGRALQGLPWEGLSVDLFLTIKDPANPDELALELRLSGATKREDDDL